MEVLGIGAGLGAVASAYGGYKQAQQSREQRRWVERQGLKAGQQIRDGRDAAIGAYNQAQGGARTDRLQGLNGATDLTNTGFASAGNRITQGYGAAMETARQYGDKSLYALTQGRDAGLAAVNQGATNSLGALYSGQGQGVSALNQGYERYSQGMTPYTGLGTSAVNGLQSLMANPGQAIQSDPGYQWRLKQGQQALERSAAARGMTASGAQMKALQDYGQGAASQEYGNIFNRYSQLAGMGQNAAGNLGVAATQTGANLANLYAGTGRAASDVYAHQGDQVANIEGQYGSNTANINQTIGGQLQGLHVGQGTQMANLDTSRADRLSSLYNGTYNNLAGDTMQTGQNIGGAFSNAASNLANTTMGVASTGGQTFTNAGNGYAGGAVGVANSINNGLGNLVYMGAQQPGGAATYNQFNTPSLTNANAGIHTPSAGGYNMNVMNGIDDYNPYYGTVA